MCPRHIWFLSDSYSKRKMNFTSGSCALICLSLAENVRYCKRVKGARRVSLQLTGAGKVEDSQKIHLNPASSACFLINVPHYPSFLSHSRSSNIPRNLGRFVFECRQLALKAGKSRVLWCLLLQADISRPNQRRSHWSLTFNTDEGTLVVWVKPALIRCVLYKWHQCIQPVTVQDRDMTAQGRHLQQWFCWNENS